MMTKKDKRKMYLLLLQLLLSGGLYGAGTALQPLTNIAKNSLLQQRSYWSFNPRNWLKTRPIKPAPAKPPAQAVPTPEIPPTQQAAPSKPKRFGTKTKAAGGAAVIGGTAYTVNEFSDDAVTMVKDKIKKEAISSGLIDWSFDKPKNQENQQILNNPEGKNIALSGILQKNPTTMKALQEKQEIINKYFNPLKLPNTYQGGVQQLLDQKQQVVSNSKQPAGWLHQGINSLTDITFNQPLEKWDSSGSWARNLAKLPFRFINDNPVMAGTLGITALIASLYYYHNYKVQQAIRNAHARNQQGGNGAHSQNANNNQAVKQFIIH